AGHSTPFVPIGPAVIGSAGLRMDARGESPVRIEDAQHVDARADVWLEHHDRVVGHEPLNAFEDAVAALDASDATEANRRLPDHLRMEDTSLGAVRDETADPSARLRLVEDELV